MWGLLVAFQEALHLGDPALAGLYGADTLPHAQTLAYAKDAFHANDLHLDADGAPRTWPTLLAFADTFGEFARYRLQSGDTSPAMLYDEDAIRVTNHYFPEPQYAYLNRLTIGVRQLGLPLRGFRACA